jgi:hypothetical protein
MRKSSTQFAKSSFFSKLAGKVTGKVFLFVSFIVTTLLFNGCRKVDLEGKADKNETSLTPQTEFEKLLATDFFVNNRKLPDAAAKRTNPQALFQQNAVETSPVPPEYPDEVPLVLGQQLNNPYTVPIMTQAYSLYYGYNFENVPVTHYYVKFSPQSESQIALLEDEQELELFDYPLDYEVISDGDYYLQPGKTHESVPDFYTTVEAGFSFPPGIPYTILANLHLPNMLGMDNMYLEEFAESIAEGATYRSVRNSDGSITVTRTDGTSGAVLSLPTLPCGPPPLRLGGKLDFNDFLRWGCSGGASNPPNPGSTTPGIYVSDTQKGIEPVGNIKILTKKWFVLQKTYTNEQGRFTFTRSYSRSAKVIMKARNTAVSVRPLRLQSFVRMSLFVAETKLDQQYTFSQLATLRYVFERGSDRGSAKYMRWLAAHAINSMNYFKQQADVDGVKTMTGHRLCIYLQKGGIDRNRGPEADITMQNYIFKKRGVGDWVFEAAKLAVYIIGENWIGAGLQIMSNVLSTQKADIIYHYKTLADNLSSNEINQQFYAAFAKAGTFKAVNENEENVNDTRWKYYFKVKGKVLDYAVGNAGFALKKAFYDSKVIKYLSPNIYDISGTIETYSSAINIAATLIAAMYYSINQPDREFYDMVEGFGEYYGHYIADRKYGTQADAMRDQQRKLIYSGTNSSHKNYLEAWNPNEQIDEHLNTKVGLFHDVEDGMTPLEVIPTTQIEDRVTGIKASFAQKGIAGYAPRLFHSPERWYMLRENVNLAVPGQTNHLNQLFQAYNVQ